MNDPNISSKDIYRAVRNYMANELGINSATVREMLDKQIAAVNPKTMAEMAVSRYFYSYGARRPWLVTVTVTSSPAMGFVTARTALAACSNMISAAWVMCRIFWTG